jgi:hypothetical protein
MLRAARTAPPVGPGGEPGPGPAVARRRGAVAAMTESAVPRFVGVLAVVLPTALLAQSLADQRHYWWPWLPVLVWLGVLATVGWLVPRACARGLGRAESLAAIGVAFAAVALVGADLRPGPAAVDVRWTLLGTVWLLALVALSRPAHVWLPGALAICAAHAAFMLRPLGWSALGLARATAGGYVVLAVPAVFAALRPAIRAHTALQVRQAALAGRARAERAAVAAILADRRDQLALLEAEALPLLAGVAEGRLDPADPAVRDRCARNAARLRSVLLDGAQLGSGLLAGLEPVLGAARARGLPVTVQVVGDPGPADPAVTRATRGAVAAVLGRLPPQPVTVTVLAAGESVELYLSFAQGPGEDCDLAGLHREVPPGHAWAAVAETGGTGPGSLEVRWRRPGGAR